MAVENDNDRIAKAVRLVVDNILEVHRMGLSDPSFRAVCIDLIGKIVFAEFDAKNIPANEYVLKSDMPDWMGLACTYGRKLDAIKSVRLTAGTDADGKDLTLKQAKLIIESITG